MPYTILLADDSVTIRRVVELMFGDTDIRVESAAGGREAVEKFQSLKPDLVLADVIMPPPTGYELCTVVKGSNNPVPVLLMAGAFEPYDEVLARECRADGHLVKPFESGYLIDRVTELLEAEKSSVDESAAQGEGAPSPESDTAELDEHLLAQDYAVHEGDGPIEVDFEPETETLVSVEQSLDQSRVLPEKYEEEEEGVAQTPVGTRLTDGMLSEENLENIARAVVAKLSEEVVREIAWEVVPDLAEAFVKERIRQLEDDDLPRK